MHGSSDALSRFRLLVGLRSLSGGVPAAGVGQARIPTLYSRTSDSALATMWLLTRQMRPVGNGLRLARHPSVTVLIVEDDLNIRDTLEDALTEEGHTVFVARNGAEALATLTHLPRPALVVLDLWMPVMDGPAFLRELRSREDFCAPERPPHGGIPHPGGASSSPALCRPCAVSTRKAKGREGSGWNRDRSFPEALEVSSRPDWGCLHASGQFNPFSRSRVASSKPAQSAGFLVGPVRVTRD
jgi:CheY-like chemotaxis protein